MNELQNVEFDLLNKFIEVCKKLNLNYYLVCGSALGAVKYGGFIPWDDDMDVALCRKDYEIFCQCAQNLLPEGIFLQTYKTDSKYPNIFAKLRNCNTTYIEQSSRKIPMNHGVYIDVFPLDYYPDDENGRKQFSKKNRIYARRLFAEYCLENITFKYNLISVLLKIAYPSTGKVLKKRDQLFKSVSPSDMIANYCGAWGQKEIVPAEWYGEGVLLEFEGIQVRVPKEYDKWLTQVYGDYMQLPPEEKRIPRHTVEFIDLEKSYTAYVNGERK